MAGAYLVSSNFKVFGEKRKADATWAFWAVIFAILAILLVFYEKMMKAVGISVSLLIGISIGYAAKYFQEGSIKQHKDAGGAEYGFLNILGVSFLTFLINIALFFIAILILELFAPTS